MKHLLLSIFLCFTLLSVAQTETQQVSIDSISKTNYEKVHELRIGAIKLLAGGFIDLSYEYINSPSTGFGASLYARLDTNLYNERFGVIPYYRFYFGNSQEFKGRGFFVEGFAFAYQGRNEYYFNSNNELILDDDFFEVAPGFALGSKWLNSSGFVFQIKLGIGRNILRNNEYDAMLMGDFYFGYRF